MAVDKVFLCHASSDKGYVDIVAAKLGRALVAYDKLTFQVGDDFADAITKALDSTGLFVFFASRQSLASYWCKFELESAKKLRIRGALERAIVIIVDHLVDFSQLPKWMTDLKAMRIPSPNAATREIEASLFSITPSGQQQAYVIRPKLQERLQTELTSSPQRAVRMLVLAGLEGIGRRSFLAFAARNVLGMQFGPVIRVDETQALEDIYLSLLGETAMPSPSSQLGDEIKAFRSLSLERQCEEIASRIHILNELNHFPCFIDHGGLLEEDGAYRPYISQLFNEILKGGDYFGVTHRRKPRFDSIDRQEAICFQFVDALNMSESQVLLTQLLRRKSSAVDPVLVHEVSENLGGYPPALHVTANYVLEYGVDVLRHNLYVLTDFTARRFLPYLRGLQLSVTESEVMHYLACERTLALDVISAALGKSIEEVATAMRRLIDLNVVLCDDGMYTIAGPLRDSVIRFKGFISPEDYAAICGRLTKAFWNDNEGEPSPSIDAVDATLHAALVGGVKADKSYSSLVRASTVHRLALEAYYQKQFDLAEKYAVRALEMDPSRWQLKSLLVKSLAQQEKYDVAEKVLGTLGSRWRKIESYLRGFIAKKQYRRRDAIKHFELAIQQGDDSISVFRDLADCLYREGRLEDAISRIERTRSKSRDNAFVLDLAIRIYVDANQPEKAAECFAELQKCDVQQRFVDHCRARLLSADGKYEEALDAANRACDMPSQPFEVYAKRIDILMHLRRYTEAASELDGLELRFTHHRRDIVHGLRAKLWYLKDDWRRAMDSWESIRDKSLDVYQALLRMILEKKAADVSLSLVERDAALRQAQAITVNAPGMDATAIGDETPESP